MKTTRCVNHVPTIKQLDNLWREACLLRDGGICVYTFEIHHTKMTKDDGVLQVHHIYEKATHRLRWDLDNGITLTKGIHFSVAHSNSPTTRNQFRSWAVDRLPVARQEKLALLDRVKSAGGVDKYGVKIYLEKIIKKFKELEYPENNVG